MSLRTLTLPACLLLVVACDRTPTPIDSTASSTARTETTEAPERNAGLQDDDVVVSTNEPFWQARTEGDTLVLTGVETGERRLPGATSSMTSDGRRITARDADGEVSVVVRRMRCEDDMSGARFPLTGLLTIDGRGPIRGCARPASMPAPRPPDGGEVATLGRMEPVPIPERFTGRWDADVEGCTSPERGDMQLTVAADLLTFHESVAVPTRVFPVDADTVQVTSEDEGEGERRQTTRTLRLTDDGARLEVAEQEGAPSVRVRCMS